MQFALPPRKTSHPPPYARPVRLPTDRRRQQLLGGLLVFTVLTLYLLVSWIRSPGNYRDHAPAGSPDVVIVTVFDTASMSEEYISKIKENREDYAQRHGYANFFTNTTAYAPYTTSSPSSWALIPALRHAMTLYAHTPFFFSLSPHAMIMSPSLSLYDHILGKSRLESLMMKDIPVVPPDSVIHTFSHLKAEKVDFILTQDYENLSHGSFILRRGDWANFLLDVWFDPLYRAYNFQKAEGHALEHIVQWHPTILAKLVLVPQRILNSYNVDMGDKSQGMYAEGDFLIRLNGCDGDTSRNCETEIDPYYRLWKKEVARPDGK